MKSLIRNIKSFIGDEKSFFKNTSIVFSGKMVIALLAFVTTPILTRLFNPEAYGTFALYNSVVQNLVILGTLALPLALNTTKKEAISKILGLTLFCILIFSVLSTIASYIIGVHYASYLSIPKNLLRYWYFIPLGFFLAAASQTLSALQLRLKEFKLTTKVSVTEAIIAKAANLVNGFLKMGGLGLILSDLIAKLVGLAWLIIRIPNRLPHREDFNLVTLKSTYKQIKDYPLFVMPAQWVSILSRQLILWFLAFQFSTDELGKYVVALSLLNIPLHILSNSFQPVITQRLVSVRDSTEDEFSMNKLLVLLTSIAILVFGGIFLIPSTWFVYFLGDQWQGVGIIIKVLCAWNLILFIDQSINNGFVVFNKQRQKLYINLIDLGLQVGVLVIATTQSMELTHFIAFFVLAKVVASGLRIGYLKASTIIH